MDNVKTTFEEFIAEIYEKSALVCSGKVLEAKKETFQDTLNKLDQLCANNTHAELDDILAKAYNDTADEVDKLNLKIAANKIRIAESEFKILALEHKLHSEE